jgi:hypothetical protein
VRLTFGVYRAATRDPSVTVSGYAHGPGFPTPFPIASSAVRRYHREGAAAAERALDRTLRRSAYWGAPGTPRAGWADAIRRCFRTYVDLASPDTRPAFETGYTTDLEYGDDELAVYVDVVFLDPTGYAGRIVLWDRTAVTRHDAVLMAAPVVRALGDELGADRIRSTEVWHLRSTTQHLVTADEALDADDAVLEIVRRAAR